MKAISFIVLISVIVTLSPELEKQVKLLHFNLCSDVVKDAIKENRENITHHIVALNRTMKVRYYKKIRSSNMIECLQYIATKEYTDFVYQNGKSKIAGHLKNRMKLEISLENITLNAGEKSVIVQMSEHDEEMEKMFPKADMYEKENDKTDDVQEKKKEL